MAAKPFFLSLLARSLVALSIECPVLECPSAGSQLALDAGTCFRHDRQSPVQKLYGGLCYDADYAKTTDPKSYCPFDPTNGEFAWIDEYFQQQKPNDPKMIGKLLSAHYHRPDPLTAEIKEEHGDLHGRLWLQTEFESGS